MSGSTEKTAITPAWLTYKQAETYSGLSKTTLWQLMKAGEIKAARIGNHSRPAVRIERVSLQAFMESAAS